MAPKTNHLTSRQDLLGYQGARAIYGAFDAFHAYFKEITRRAKKRFENREWVEGQQDAIQRLELYGKIVNRIVQDIHLLLKDKAYHKPIWAKMKHEYSQMITGRNDIELAETFFNSITRRIFSTVGVDPKIEFVDSNFIFPTGFYSFKDYTSYPFTAHLTDLFKEILRKCNFQAPFYNLEEDVNYIARAVTAALKESWGDLTFDEFQVIDSIFYRNKGAYLIGKFIRGDQHVPLVLPLIHVDKGIAVDAVLTTINEASIIFSFTRSYFHVECERPYNLVQFLKSLMPHKPLSELYTSIGYHKHGKTELYRAMLAHLRNSTDQFEPAAGEKGMVMTVFTLPSFPVVFKIIKDKFAQPKTTSREQVKEKYRLVFKHDRAGRLVDAQEFEHLKFDRNRFTPQLLEELCQEASRMVEIQGNSVIIHHLYTERRLKPLNIHIQNNHPTLLEQVVIDFGNCIKDLAAVNIFPGDILLKNFGVTRQGRVVFYDYDELALLTECRFRKLPLPHSFEDELSAEPWFSVQENDIFPEEFATFLELSGTLREIFINYHSDLFEVSYWREMQKRHEAGEILDIFPYSRRKRLRPEL